MTIFYFHADLLRRHLKRIQLSDKHAVNISVFALRRLPTLDRLCLWNRSTDDWHVNVINLSVERTSLEVSRVYSLGSFKFTAGSEEKNISLFWTIGGIAKEMWRIRTMQDDYKDVIARTTQDIKSSNCRMPTQSEYGYIYSVFAITMYSFHVSGQSK